MVKSRKRGAVAVEFAVITPVFILIFLFTVDLCNNIFMKQSLQTAAYEGARTAIVPGSNIYDIETKVQETATARNVGPVTVTIVPSNFDTAPIGTFITIEVQATKSSPSLLSQFNPNSNVVERVSMMKEY
jgi:Flp pilus assembly protein TadG